MASKTAKRSGTARRIRTMKDWRGDAALYELDPPFKQQRFVVVSAIDAMFTGPETYVFASDAAGEPKSWLELGGSFRGARDHATALAKTGRGYAITKRRKAVKS